MTTEAEAALIDFLSQFEQVAFRKCRSGWRGEATEDVEFTKTYGEWAADLAAVIAATGEAPEVADEIAPEAGPWTDDRIREGFIDDGGRAEYYDPINGAREERRIAGAIFDSWLKAHDAAVIAATAEAADARALRAFATELRERYSEDVFSPMTDKDHRSVNDALAGRAEGTHVTRDRVSADMMRRAASQADQYADELAAGFSYTPEDRDTSFRNLAPKSDGDAGREVKSVETAARDIPDASR